MTEPDDHQLLAEFARENSETAFAAVVQRHINLVYSTALRSVGNNHAAEEITQAVFIILARKANNLSRKIVLSGWLYQTTRLTAANFLRTEIRRQQREQEAYMQSTLNEPESEAWRQIAPLLDDAISRLGEKDRNAVVLRFFENKNLQEVGLALGASEDAAKMRVNRALEKLRQFLTKRGVTLSSVAIAGAVSTNSVQAAPVALTKTIAAVATTKGVAVSGSTLTLIKTTLKIMAWTKMKTTIVAGVGILLAAGTVTVTVKQIDKLKSDEPWRVERISSDAVAKLPPEVRILPTKFAKSGNLAAAGPGVDKFVGIGQPVVNIVWAAYNWPQGRTVFADAEPSNRYDFVATLDQGSREALQEELKNKLGLTGRHETRDMDVLLLKVRNANAPGLHPPTQEGYCYLTHEWNRVEIKWANETISKLGEFLESASKMPIIDQTGLTKHYSLDIKWEEPEGGDPEHKALQRVLLDQLGLELVPSREPIEMLVVEKIN
jgi:uncharacterized protein (TIGR03435 family)